jgi:hypothetical protein
MNNDITLFKLIAAIFMGLFTGIEDSVRGAWLYTKNYFRLVQNSWRWIWNTPAYGPVIKTVSFILAPFIEIFGIPIMLFVGFLAGLWYGFYDTAFGKDGFREGNAKLVKEANEWCEVFLDDMHHHEHPPLENGEKPFDINPFLGAVALVVGIIVSVIEFIGVGVISLWRVLPALVSGWRFALKTESGFFFTIGLLFLMTVTVPLIVPLSFIVAAVVGLAEGAYYSYTESYSAAFSKSGERVSDWNKLTREFCKWGNKNYEPTWD